jgi:hypothetical protein
LHGLTSKEICMAPKTAKRKTRNPPSADTRKETGVPAAPEAVEQKVVALAEQMGRLIGTVQGKAEGWLDPKQISDQITRIRDGATELLSHLGSAAGKSAGSARQSAVAARGRSGGKVDAPGKKHRPPPPSTRPAKPSDDRVAKLKAANRSIRRPRQG